MESIEKTIEFYLANKNRFIGLDIAGDEPQFPNAQYASLFKPLLDENLPITIHAGEASGPESIWAAIDLLGAKRIGHGIHAVHDPKLMDALRDRKILLEMCPTSNRITSAWPDLKTHPLKKCLDHGIPVSINTDDPGMFGITLGDEVEIAKKMVGLTNEEVARTFRYAHEHSFLP
jgi:adenosine deaminase